MTAATLTLTDLPQHPEKGWPVDPRTGIVYGVGGRWKGRPIGSVGSHGYLVSSRLGRAFLMHRVVWEACVGPIPQKMTINHKNGVKTDNRLVNLEVATYSQNTQHAFDTGLNVAKPPRGPRHPCFRITDEIRLDILERIARGETGASIARSYQLSQTTVSKVKLGRR